MIPSSLIIPVYNSEKYLDKTIQSIKNQTINLSQVQVIFVNDGSTDNSEKIILENFSYFPRRKLISQENQGSASAKNIGCNFSDSKYLFLLDSDDVLEQNALENMIEFMNKNPFVQYSYSQHKRINECDEVICERGGYAFSRERLLHYNFVGAIECFTKNLFNNVGGFDKCSYVEDYDFALRASEILEDNQIKQNPVFLYKYRIHNQNKSWGIEKSRNAACNSIKNSLKRKERIDAEVFWSHITEDNYNYYNWKEK